MGSGPTIEPYRQHRLHAPMAGLFSYNRNKWISARRVQIFFPCYFSRLEERLPGREILAETSSRLFLSPQKKDRKTPDSFLFTSDPRDTCRQGLIPGVRLLGAGNQVSDRGCFVSLSGVATVLVWCGPAWCGILLGLREGYYMCCVVR